MDFRHAILGLVLLFCLSVITLFASIGVSTMEEQLPDEFDYNIIWAFMQIWAVLGMFILPIYVIFFTKFNNPIRKIEK